MPACQNTLAGAYSVEGTAHHRGEPVSVEIRPGPPGSGIVFRRTDLEGEPALGADVRLVAEDAGSGVLGDGHLRLAGAAELLAALVAAKVDNAEIRLRGPDLPALEDGVAGWCRILDEVGVEEQAEPARVLAVEEPFGVSVGESRYTVSPYPGFRVSAEVRTSDAGGGDAFASARVERRSFCRHLGQAEPGGEAGGDRDPGRDAVVEITGYLALLGARIQAHVMAECPAGDGNLQLARELAALLERGADVVPELDIQDILEHMPHRYPMLLVDRIQEFHGGERIVGLKNVTANEPYFQGHYPGHPIMPGVLIVEAMAQVGGLLLMNEFEATEDKVVYFMSLDDVKWRRPVIPGDQLVFEVEMLQFRGSVCRMRGVGTVDGERVAEATMMARVMDR